MMKVSSKIWSFVVKEHTDQAAQLSQTIVIMEEVDHDLLWSWSMGSMLLLDCSFLGATTVLEAWNLWNSDHRAKASLTAMHLEHHTNIAKYFGAIGSSWISVTSWHRPKVCVKQVNTKMYILHKCTPAVQVFWTQIRNRVFIFLV